MESGEEGVDAGGDPVEGFAVVEAIFQVEESGFEFVEPLLAVLELEDTAAGLLADPLEQVVFPEPDVPVGKASDGGFVEIARGFQYGAGNGVGVADDPEGDEEIGDDDENAEEKEQGRGIVRSRDGVAGLEKEPDEERC